MALPQPSTLYSLNCQSERSKSSSGPVFHIRNGLCVCQFWVSGRMKQERQRSGGKKQHMDFMMNVGGDSTCFLWWWGSGGFWETHARTQTQADILTVPVWLGEFNKCIRKIDINYSIHLLWESVYSFFARVHEFPEVGAGDGGGEVKQVPQG